MAEKTYRRRLSALLSADVEGYSLLMRDDEEATVRTVTAFRAAISNQIQQYRGRVVDSPGDNILAEFTSVVDAVNCAVEIQREIAERNLELPENRRMKWRIGINLGDVIEDGQRIYGDGVNVAARMESLAEGGGICLSGTVYDAIENKIGLEYEYLGEQAVKNIPKPIRAYRVLSHPGDAAHRVIKAKKAESKKWRNIGIAAAVVLILASAVVVWYCWLRPPSIKTVAQIASGPQVKALPLPDKPSIAVLPFVNTSGDPKQDYLSDGITEQLIYALSRVPGLFVIARASSFFYKGKKVKVQQVGRELGVKYVLEGNVDRSGDRLRITAQLINAQTGHHLWSARWDRKLKDIFAIQDAVARKVVATVYLKAIWNIKDIDSFVKNRMKNVEALLASFKGNKYINQWTREGNFKAKKYARRAIALDPGHPYAYSLLATAYFMDVWLGISRSPRESFQKAAELCRKALAIDKSDPNANTTLAYIFLFQRRYQKALELAERAIATNPQWPHAYNAKGEILRYMGRPRQALTFYKKAIRLSPQGPAQFYLGLGAAYAGIKQYEKSITALKKAVSLAPNNIYTHLSLTRCYVRTGRMKLARAEADHILRIKPDFSLAWLARRLALHKDRAYVKRFLEALRQAGLK